MTIHPITPPPELMEQYMEMFSNTRLEAILQFMYQDGADAELEACCEWLDQGGYTKVSAGALRHVRRREPPNLEEKALDAQRIALYIKSFKASCDIIRQALEALPNDN